MANIPFPDESTDAVKAWAYVGRFMFRFALIESTINELFGGVLGLDFDKGEAAQRKAYAHLILIANVDLRKKLLLTKLVLEKVDVIGVEALDSVHCFHDIRNVLAHCSFSSDIYPDSANGSPVQGVSFDYVSSKGEAPDRFYSYAELDKFDTQMSELWNKLEILLGRMTSITIPELALAEAIEQAIATSDNIVRFPKSPTERD